MTLTVTFQNGTDTDTMTTLTFSYQWGTNPHKAAMEHASRWNLVIVDSFEG